MYRRSRGGRQVWINVYMAGCTVIAAVGAAKGARSYFEIKRGSGERGFYSEHLTYHF